MAAPLRATIHGLRPASRGRPRLLARSRAHADACDGQLSGRLLSVVWESDDCNASLFCPDRGASGECELPSIRGPYRMIRIYDWIGDLSKPCSVTVDEEYGVKPICASAGRFESQLLAVGRPSRRSSLRAARFHRLRYATFVYEPNGVFCLIIFLSSIFLTRKRRSTFRPARRSACR
jgi:hypothetical protein